MDKINSLFSDIKKYDKIDERKKNNQFRDYFMILCFKIFIISIVLSTSYILIGKHLSNIKTK